jgi:hypothetical protein
MEQVEVTPGTRDALLREPYKIYHGLSPLISYTAVVAAYIFFAGIMAYALVSGAGNGKSGATAIYIAAFIPAPLLFYYRVLQPWLNLRTPVLTLSAQSIQLRARLPIPWRDYDSSRVFTLHSGGATLSFLIIRMKDGGKARLFTGDLGIDDGDLLRLFELYQAAAEGRL